MNFKINNLIVLSMLIISLVACGGGGKKDKSQSGSDPSPPQSSASPTFSISVIDIKASRVSNDDVIDVEMAAIESGVVSVDP